MFVSLVRIGDKKIVIKGSANMRSSRCVEEFTAETCEDLYHNPLEWHDAILKDYGTIKKAIRASLLFDNIVAGAEHKKQW